MCHVGKVLSVRLGQRKSAVSLGNQSNSVHVHDKNPATVWESTLMFCISGDPYRRLVIETSVIKRVPNFDSMENTLHLMVIYPSSYLKQNLRFSVLWISREFFCFVHLIRSL